MYICIMKKFVIINSVFGSELISNTLCFFTELRHNISKAEGQVLVSELPSALLVQN